MTFVGDVLSGKATADDIDDYVEQWHRGTVTGPLHKFLGMRWDEYASFVRDPSVVEEIVESYRP